MKKWIICFLIIAILLAGCGNMSLGLENHTYNKVHVDTHSYSCCFTIRNWHGSGTCVEVLTEEVGYIYLSEGTYILLESKKDCPFCGENP